MNLSCNDCSQSASDRCSSTPPGEEPALLTMMSTRPSALWACATKFLASASLLRSAGVGTSPPAVGPPRELGGRLPERLLAPRADGDIAAFPRQRAGDAFADARAAARDQRGLAVKLEVHVALLVRSAPEGSAQAGLCASQRPAS